MASEPIPPMETTADERSMACLAHVLQLVGGWIGPLIIFFVKRESTFVKFHAVQVLLFQLGYLLVSMIGVFFWFAFIMSSVAMSTSKPTHGPPPGLLFVFPVFMLVFMLGWLTMLVLAIVYGIKANRGEWAQYPVIGGWARRILHI